MIQTPFKTLDTEAAGKLESLTTNDIPVVLLGIPSAGNLASAVSPEMDVCELQKFYQLSFPAI